MSLTLNGTTGISGVDGSSTTPAVKGVDANTGIVFGNNIMACSLDGTERIKIDSTGRVGMNQGTPTAHLEIIHTSTGRSYAAGSSTELVVERDANCGISIISKNDSRGKLNFGDPEDEDAGAISYDHSASELIFRTNGGDQCKLDSGGKLIMGSPTAVTTVGNSIITSGRIQTEATYSQTTGSSANLFITQAGLFLRSTSSSRYKKDIADATSWGLADVLKLKPKTFKSNATGENADDTTYAGFIAEDVHDIGLTNFVEYNDSNQPDAIHYGNMVALLTKAIQELNTKVTTLETKVAALEAA
tara:strand:- start:13 stop:918 length:906 start_codon:yes stop_codon:yes gene_type:complete